VYQNKELKKWDSKKNILAFQTTESLGYHGSYELLKKKMLNSKIKVIASNKNMMTKLGALIGINSASEDDEERMNFDKKIGDAMHIFKAFLHDEERLRLIFSFCVGKMTGVNSQILQLLFKPLFKLDPNDKRHINYISILLTSYASNNIDYLKILNKKNPDFWNDSSSAVQFLTALTYIHLATQRELFVQEEKDKVAKKENKEGKDKEAKKENKEEYIIYSEEPQEALDKFKMILNSKNQNLILGAANSYERIILSNCYEADSRYLYDLETLKLRLSFSLFKHLRYFNFIMKYKEEAEKKGYHLDLRHFKPKEIGFMNNHYGEDYNYGDINLPDWTPQMIGQFIDHAVQLNSKMLKKSQTPLYELFQIIYNYTQLYKVQDEINEKKLQNKANEQNDNKENVINELNDLLESLKKLKEKYSSDHDSVYDFWLAQMEHDRYILSPQKEYLDASIHYIDEFLYKYPWQLEANLEKRSLLILSKKYEEDLLQKKQDELKQIEAEEKARKEAEEKAKEENEESEEAKEENEESEKVKEKKKEIEDVKLEISSLKNKIKFYQDRTDLIKNQNKESK